MEKDDLNQLSKKEGFNIPEGYFNSFPERVQKRIAIKKNSASIRNFFRRPQLYVPLILVLIPGIVLLLKEQKTEKITPINESLYTQKDTIVFPDNSIARNIDREIIKNYFIEEFKASEVEEISKEEDSVAPESNPGNNYLSQNTIEEMILESGIEEDLIIEELLRD